MLAIEARNLTKKFNGFTAVDNISFDINSGEIFGLLGPNGAGKTTTISMLSTTLKPTSGSAKVNGFDILDKEGDVRKSIGVVFQDPSLDDELTAFENMDFHGRLYRIPKAVRRKKSIELLKLVELDDRKDDLAKTFSGGMKRRLEIARGLLHEPKVLFLDEPTIGLDPQTRNYLWGYIKKLSRDKGITVILTTHYMDEADMLCGRVAIIDKGRVIALNTPQRLKDELGGDVITVKCQMPDKLCPLVKAAWVKSVKKHDGFVTISLEDAEKHVTGIVNVSERNGIDIESLSIHKPTLEDVFLHFTGRTIREQEADPKYSMRLRHRMMAR